MEIMVCWWCWNKTEGLIKVIKVHPTRELKILEAIQQLSRNQLEWGGESQSIIKSYLVSHPLTEGLW